MEITRDVVFELYEKMCRTETDRVLKFLNVNLQITECMTEWDEKINPHTLRTNIEILNILMKNFLNKKELEECIKLSNVVIARIGQVEPEAIMFEAIIIQLKEELTQKE